MSQITWRKITSRKRYRTESHPKNAWSELLTLSCGHVKHYKASKSPSSKSRCRECEEDLLEMP